MSMSESGRSRPEARLPCKYAKRAPDSLSLAIASAIAAADDSSTLIVSQIARYQHTGAPEGRTTSAPRAGIHKPDVFVVPKDVARSAIDPRVRTYYASDLLLVAEVVSPRSGSERAERVQKVGEYAKAGIPLYWIIAYGVVLKLSMLCDFMASPLPLHRSRYGVRRNGRRRSRA
jgi:putative restriction endonuclease